MSLLDALLLDPVRINVWIAKRADSVGGSGTYQDQAFAAFPVFRQVVIRNNVIRYVDNSTEATPYNQGIAVSAAEDILIENNVIDLLSSNPIAITSNCKNVKVFNNRRSTGQLIPATGRLTLADGSVVRRDEVSVVIEDAMALAMF